MPARKFEATPISIETKSSKAARQPSPEEKDGKAKPRKFAVQPVEHSVKSSKGGHEASPESMDETPKARRFAPEVVEQSHKSNMNKAELEKSGHHVKFTPQLVGTIHGTNRKLKDDQEPSAQQNAMPEKKKQSPRKFAPILLDTAQRSRKAGDAASAASQDHKTEAGYHLHAREHRRHITGGTNSLDDEDIDMLDVGQVSPKGNLESSSEPRRQLAPIDGSSRPISLSSQRTHSYHCPDLDTIQSSESEQHSGVSSLSTSPRNGSPMTASDGSFNEISKHATRIRESVDEDFTHYLLQLEAKKAEQRMQDQALAAFPNAEKWENVPHFVDRDDDSDDMEVEDRPVTYDMEEELLLEMAARRESTAKINWEQLELQRHAEKMEQERAAAKTTAKTQSQSPWWNPAAGLAMAQADHELKSMRDRARPPLLGFDLVFPRCRSPEPARFDVTQGSTMLRNQMCYLTEQVEAHSRCSGVEGGLWRAPNTDEQPFASVKRPSQPTNKGLWGGFCVGRGDDNTNPGLAPPSGPTGLLTPRVEYDVNPFEQSIAGPIGTGAGGLGSRNPPTPPASLRKADLGQIHHVLSAEQELDEVMEREFPDSFITQVYNYLSLGYPALARPFDEELSKISRISMAELRQDDKKARAAAAAPRGYIRLGPDFEGGGGEGLTEQEEDICMRWRALKRYVREWARQEQNMVPVDGPGGNWGTGARRGSWAI